MIQLSLHASYQLVWEKINRTYCIASTSRHVRRVDRVQFSSCFSHVHSLVRGLACARKRHFQQGQQAPVDFVLSFQIILRTVLAFFSERSVKYMKYLIRKVPPDKVHDAKSLAEHKVGRPSSCQHLQQHYPETVHVSGGG